MDKPRQIYSPTRPRLCHRNSSYLHALASFSFKALHYFYISLRLINHSMLFSLFCLISHLLLPLLCHINLLSSQNILFLSSWLFHVSQITSHTIVPLFSQTLYINHLRIFILWLSEKLSSQITFLEAQNRSGEADREVSEVSDMFLK